MLCSLESPMLNIRDYLLKCASDESFTFDMKDFGSDCDEILKDYVENGDPQEENRTRQEIWGLMKAWQRDKEYISSLNLHRVIAKHVRISCRNAHREVTLDSWTKLNVAQLQLDGLADEIAMKIRDTWDVRAQSNKIANPKFSEGLLLDIPDKEYFGLEGLIGYPATNMDMDVMDFLDLMKREHEQGDKFLDRLNTVVDPKVEWNVVLQSKKWNIDEAGCESNAQLENRIGTLSLEHYLKCAQDVFEKAKMYARENRKIIEALNTAEVAALRLWTGPMREKYAAQLRDSQKPSRYVNTLHAINSGITKLARISCLPAHGKVYRGYQKLKMQELKKDAPQCVGGVETCVLATSEDFQVAVDYSKDGAFILEIDVGHAHPGADVSWLSQYPNEREFLFTALSRVEFVRGPQYRFVEGFGTILVYPVAISTSVKTLGEFAILRKELYVNLVDVLTQQTQRFIAQRVEGCAQDLIKSLGAACKLKCEDIRREADETQVGLFHEGNPTKFVHLVEETVMFQSRSSELIDLALRWFSTHTADPSEVDRLQDWQLQALRTAFKSEPPPIVKKLVLEQVPRDVDSLFGDVSLDVGEVHMHETARSVAKLLSLNPDLVKLNMKVSSATTELWETLFKVLCPGRPSFCINGFNITEYATSTLQQLELRNSEPQMAAMIAPALRLHMPIALTSFSLRGSPIGCIGAEYLGQMFRNLQRLTYVNLRECRIADRGCTAISQSLSTLTELKDLNLAYNMIKDLGFDILASAVTGLPRLKIVDVRFNKTQLPTLRFETYGIIKNHIVSKLSQGTVLQSVSWSPKGDRIVSGSYDKVVIIWDAQTGVQTLTLKGHTSYVNSLAWSPKCDRIASGSDDKTIGIWDAETGAQVSALKGHASSVLGVAWSPNGEQIVSGGYGARNPANPFDNPGEIIVWDVNSENQVSQLKGHSAGVMSVAWSPNGSQIASGSRDKSIIMWAAREPWNQILVLKAHTSSVNSVVWSPQGDSIASGSDDKTIIIWDAKSGGQVRTLKGHMNYVRNVAWSSLGDKIASGSADKTIIIWDSSSGEIVSKFDRHASNVRSVSWSPSGDQIVSASWDNTIIIWDSSQPKVDANGVEGDEEMSQGKIVRTIEGYTSPVSGVAWSANGKQIVSGSFNKSIIIWDVESGIQKPPFMGHSTAVSSVAWSPDGEHIVSGGCEGIGNPAHSQQNSGEIIVWVARTGVQLWSLRGSCADVMSVVWSPSGNQIASGCNDGSIIVWDASTGEQVSNLKLHGDRSYVGGLSWSPSGDRLSCWSADKSMVIWDAKPEGQVSVIKGHSADVRCVAWSPIVDLVASGSKNDTIIIWDVKKGEQVSTLGGHSGSVRSVAWSLQGDRIASGSEDTTIIIWDANTWKQLVKLKGHADHVMSVAWSPIGDQIVSGSLDQTIIIWDANTQDQVSTLETHVSCVKCVAWSPKGDRIASRMENNTIVIRDIRTMAQLSESKGHLCRIISVGWSPSGNRIASCYGDKTVVIWDANSWGQVSLLNGHTATVSSVAWSPDGEHIVSGGCEGIGNPAHSQQNSGEIIVWVARTGVQLWSLRGSCAGVMSVVWSPSGNQIASGCNDGSIIVWDASTGEQVSNLKLHGDRSYVGGLSWSPSGDRLSCWSADKSMVIWDAKPEGQVSVIKGHSADVRCVAWSPIVDLIASGSKNDTIIIWDVKKGEQVSTLGGHSGSVRSVAWSLQGDRIASGSEDTTIIIWDANTWKQLVKLKGHADHVMSVAWSPIGDQIVSGSLDQTIIIWDANTQDQVSTLKADASHVNSMSWSPKGDRIVSRMEDNSVVIWDTMTKSGDRVLTLPRHSFVVTCVAWSPEGNHIATGSWDKTIFVWDAKAGDMVSKLEGHSDYVSTLSWSPDGAQIVSGGLGLGFSANPLHTPGEIIIWDANYGKQVLALKGHSAGVMSVAWCASRQQIASGCNDGSITIWDAKSEEQILTLKGHSSSVNSVAWSPNGDSLASGSADKQVIVWDAKKGVQHSVLRGHTDKICCVAWSPNGEQVASASDDKTVLIWDVFIVNQFSDVVGKGTLDGQATVMDEMDVQGRFAPGEGVEFCDEQMMICEQVAPSPSKKKKTK